MNHEIDQSFAEFDARTKAAFERYEAATKKSVDEYTQNVKRDSVRMVGYMTWFALAVGFVCGFASCWLAMR